MKLALAYIGVAVVSYMTFDVVSYIFSSLSPKRIFKAMRDALGVSESEPALAAAKAFHEDVLKWIENDYRLEYKSVWVGVRLAEGLENLCAKWKGTWPEGTEVEFLKTADKLRGFYPKYVKTLFKAVFIAILLALFIRSFFVQAFKIPSGSMIPTLDIGDQLLVVKCEYGIENPFTSKKLFTFRTPKRGDVVVFKPPTSVSGSWFDREITVPFSDKVIYKWRYQVDFIKRVVGLPGDKIEVKDGILYVNDKALQTDPISEYDYTRKYGNFERTIKTEVFEETIDGKKHLLLHDGKDRMMGDNFGPIIVAPGEFFAMGDNRDDSADSRTWTAQPAKLEDIRGKAFIIHFSWDDDTGRPRFDRIGKLIH